jgi:DNA ligase-1
MAQFQPNLAAKLKKGQTYENDVFPKIDWASGWLVPPKLDGIRITMHPELGPVSRTLEPTPNRALRKFFEDQFDVLKGLDGEFIWGNYPAADYSFQKTFSKYSSHMDSDLSQVHYYAFDDISDSGDIMVDRAWRYTKRVKEADLPWLHAVAQPKVFDQEAFEACEREALEQHYEGVMLRKASSLYKEGRSTWREGGLGAIKRFEDAEAVVIGFEEMEHNENEATTDARGYTKRSSAQAGKMAAGTLGKLVVTGHTSSPFAGIEFKVGSGFTKEQRQALWDDGIDVHRGRVVTFKYQPHGIKVKPRAPIFKSFRVDI